MNTETLPYRRLAAAILKRAALDAKGKRPRVAARARCWLLTSEWAAWLFDALDLDAGWVRRWARDLPPEKQLTFEL